MTDLERLAEQTIDGLERTDSPLTIEQDDEAKGIIKNALEAAHAAGRIEGLEEATRLAEKSESLVDAQGEIRARIQELKEE